MHVDLLCCAYGFVWDELFVIKWMAIPEIWNLFWVSPFASEDIKLKEPINIIVVEGEIPLLMDSCLNCN